MWGQACSAELARYGGLLAGGRSGQQLRSSSVKKDNERVISVKTLMLGSSGCTWWQVSPGGRQGVALEQRGCASRVPGPLMMQAMWVMSPP